MILEGSNDYGGKNNCSAYQRRRRPWYCLLYTSRLEGRDLDLSYRHSAYSSGFAVITSVEVSLRPGDPVAIKEAMDDYLGRRKSKQPLEWPSAGSVFKRPAKGYASALIDQCGLKGRRVGGAVVSPKHAGFIINDGGASLSLIHI